jgi:hypothetical protein
MSEHAWVHENLAAYVAGGLDAGEGERVEAHAAACESCAAALREARAFDRDMNALFAATRPAPALEDRLIQVLRATTRPRRVPHWSRKLAWGAAATVALGATGAGMSRLMDPNGLPFPGTVQVDQTVAEEKPRDAKTVHYTQPGILDSTHEMVLEDLRNPEQMAGEISRRARDIDGDGPIDLLPHIEQDNLYGGTVKGKYTTRSESSSDKTSVQVQDGLSNTVIMGDGSVRTVPGSDPASAWKLQAQGGFGGGMMGIGGGGGLGGMQGGMMPGGGPDSTTYFTPFRPEDGKQWYGMGGPGTSNGQAAMDGTMTRKMAGKPVAGGEKGDQGKGAGKSLEKDEGRPARPDEEGEKKQPPDKTLAQTAPAPANVKYFVPADHRDKDGQKADNKSGKEDKDKKENNKPNDDSREGKESAPGRTDPKPQAAPEQDGGTITTKSTSVRYQSQPAPEPAAARKVIRSGDIEFEVESFDSAAATVTKLVMGVRGGFVATVNSDKLPNGKVKGSLVVRVPPEQLDGLVLDLRKELGKGGELKGLRIGSQDITKQYYDLESRLKAAKTMQERLLKIIQEGKGEIKQLLEAEKELGVWRTKIEEFEGELRYYNSVVSLSTLTVVLAEKEIRSAVDIVEREMVQAGVEVEDVDKAREQVLAAVAEAKGRVTKAEMKQFAAGQFNATLTFEVPPGAGGPLRDRLRQVGNVVRLEIDRVQQAEGGQATRDAKVRRGDTHFNVQLYNVTGIAPRETTTVTLAAADVPTAYRALQEAVAKSKGRVLKGQLNEQDRANVNADFEFEVRRTDEAAIQAAIGAAGEIVSRTVNRAALADNTTDAKVRIQANLVDAARITPRETTKLTLASPDVPAAYKALQAAIAQAKGRVTKAKLNENDRNNITAELHFEVRRADEQAIEAALQSAGETIGRQVSRSEQSQNVTDSRVKYETLLGNAAAIAPRELDKLSLEVRDVEATVAVFAAQVKEVGGRVISPEVAHKRDGSVTAILVYDVPLPAATGLIEQFKKAGTVRTQQSAINPQAPDGKLAIARINVVVANTELIVAKDEGLWAQVRSGLSTSIRFLLFSLSWIIFGLLVVLPWALVGYGAYRLARRLFGSPATSAPAPATPAA